MTIEIGSWVIPLVLSAVFWLLAMSTWRGESNGLGGSIVGVFLGGVAVILSLIVWLIWALLR